MSAEETPSEGAPEWMVSYADMITIMTKGRNVQPLPQVLSDISKMVYDQMIKVQSQS